MCVYFITAWLVTFYFPARYDTLLKSLAATRVAPFKDYLLYWVVGLATSARCDNLLNLN